MNAVAPGPIWTPLQPAAKSGDSMPKFGLNTPLGRPGQPAELAGAFVFLASPHEASYVSGTVVGVTGGRPSSRPCADGPEPVLAGVQCRPDTPRERQ